MVPSSESIEDGNHQRDIGTRAAVRALRRQPLRYEFRHDVVRTLAPIVCFRRRDAEAAHCFVGSNPCIYRKMRTKLVLRNEQTLAPIS